MVWQLDRRDQRADRNELIESRSEGSPLSISEALALGTPSEIDYQRVEDVGRWVSPEVVRVANRSQAGQAGEWVVGLFETGSGEQMLVNRGFVTLNADGEAPVDADGHHRLAAGVPRARGSGGRRQWTKDLSSPGSTSPTSPPGWPTARWPRSGSSWTRRHRWVSGAGTAASARCRSSPVLCGAVGDLRSASGVVVYELLLRRVARGQAGSPPTRA